MPSRRRGVTRMTETCTGLRSHRPTRIPHSTRPCSRSWPRRARPTSTGRCSGAPGTPTACSRRPGRSPPCGRRWLDAPGGRRPLPRGAGPALPPVGMGDHRSSGKKDCDPRLGTIAPRRGRWLADTRRPHRSGRASMIVHDKIYVNGAWVPSTGKGKLEVIDSATGEDIAGVAEGRPKSGQGRRSAAAASRARPPRRAPSAASADAHRRSARRPDRRIAQIISHEVGMPMTLLGVPRPGRLPAGRVTDATKGAERFESEEEIGNRSSSTSRSASSGARHAVELPAVPGRAEGRPGAGRRLHRPAEASEVAPIDASILADVIDEVGFAAGVYDLVSGVGPVVGEAIAAPPKVDMVSFTVPSSQTTGHGARRRGRQAGLGWNSAAGRPTSCSTTPTSPPPCRPGCSVAT